MGIIFWFVVIFVVFLTIKLGLYIMQSKVDKLTKNSKLLWYIHLHKKLIEILYNYLAVIQIIVMTSLTLYLRYEYYEKGCLELTCFISDTQISATKLVKLDIVVSIILIIGYCIHSLKIFVLVWRYQWFAI